MLLKIKDNYKIVKDNSSNNTLDTNIKEKTANYWKEFTKDKKNYFDGDIITVYKFDEKNNTIYLKKSKYSELIYSKYNDELDIRSIFVSILFKTIDNYYVIIKNNNEKINIIGGIVDESDLNDEPYNPKSTLKREVLEELNIDIDNKEQVIKYEKAFLKTPNPGRNYGIIYYGYLNMDRTTLNKYLNDNKKYIDNEVNELLLLTKNEALNLDLSDDDISYLKELLEKEYDI